MLSNDIKWNKIQKIISLLSDIQYNKYSEYQDYMEQEIAAKLAHRETWILANELYDISTEGLEDMTECFDYTAYPTSVSDVINDVINFSTYENRSLEWYLNMRDLRWEQYDYENS